MGNNSDTKLMNALRFVAPVLISAAFTVGVYSSQIKTDKAELAQRVDQVRITAKAELDSAVRLRSMQVEGLERRVSALETMARENTATNQEILRKLTELQTSSRYQNDVLTELKIQVKELTLARKD